MKVRFCDSCGKILKSWETHTIDIHLNNKNKDYSVTDIELQYCEDCVLKLVRKTTDIGEKIEKQLGIEN